MTTMLDLSPLHVTICGEPYSLAEGLMHSLATICGVELGGVEHSLLMVEASWPPGHSRLRVTFQHLTAPGSGYAEDLTYLIDAHDWLTREVLSFPRTGGVILVVDPRYGRGMARRVRARLDILQSSFGAWGMESWEIPLAVLVTHREAPAHTRYPTQAIEDQISWPKAMVMDVEASSTETLTMAVDELIRHAVGVRPVTHSAISITRPEDRKCVTVPMSALDPLDVLAHLKRGEDGAALGMLLSAWRSCRAVPVAELIEGLAYSKRSPRPARFDHRSWIAACRRRNLLDLPMLADCVMMRDAASEVSVHTEQVVERLQGLCGWEDDPRVTPRLASMLADLTCYRKVPVQRAIGKVMSAHDDPRALRTYERYLEDIRRIRPPRSFRESEIVYALPYSQPEHPDRYAEGLPTGLEIPPQHQDAWNDLCERIRRPLPRAEDMEAIAASPHDDELRRELAIRMQERGDPRGEFILLQLRKASGDRLSPEEHEREQALKRTYAWDWLGGIADVVDVENCVFERGYPVKVTVWTPNTRAIADAIGRPEWGTVRELRWGGDPCWEEDEADPALVNHPVMKSLQVVTTKMPEDPEELAALRRVAWGR